MGNINWIAWVAFALFALHSTIILTVQYRDFHLDYKNYQKIKFVNIIETVLVVLFGAYFIVSGWDKFNEPALYIICALPLFLVMGFTYIVFQQRVLDKSKIYVMKVDEYNNSDCTFLGKIEESGLSFNVVLKLVMNIGEAEKKKEFRVRVVSTSDFDEADAQVVLAK